MRKSLVLMLLMLILSICQGQWLTSSRLPIIIITTDVDPNTGSHYSIPDEPKVGAHMKILYVNDTTDNYLSNQNDSAFLNYDGRIAIELRGSTSQGHNKKPYGFETRMADDVTNNNVSLLGFPAENDWVLTPMNDEPSFVRDALSFCLAREMGHYAPRTKYCEVIVNDDYRGLYYLTEKIKIDDHRVDVLKMDTTDNSFPNVTGGYIFKADKTTGGDVPAWTTSAYGYWEEVSYIYHDPKPEIITPVQGAYLQVYFDTIRFLTATQNQDVSNGFPAYLDVPSFVDYMILGEFSSNVDIYQKSTFFHRTETGNCELDLSGTSIWRTGMILVLWGVPDMMCSSLPMGTIPVPISGISCTRMRCTSVCSGTGGSRLPPKVRFRIPKLSRSLTV